MSLDAPNRALVDRVEQLERRGVNLKRGIYGLVLLQLAALVFIGRLSSKVAVGFRLEQDQLSAVRIQARELNVDDQHERGGIHAFSVEDWSALRLRDSDGQIRVELGVRRRPPRRTGEESVDEVALRLVDQDGTMRAELRMVGNEDPTFRLFDARKEPLKSQP